MPKKHNYYSRGIGYILFTAGVILSVWLGTAVWKGYDTRTWQQTNGLIYRSNMIQTTQLGEQALYKPDLSYRYQFRGDAYVGQNLYRTDLIVNPAVELEQKLAQFPVGSIQLIYVNPEYPEESILIKGTQHQLIMGLIFAITCFAIGLLSFRNTYD